MQRVLVIGGGVIGTACAYYLTKSGREVTLVEAGAFGRGCSHGNCGLIALSHVLPLNEPGAVKKTLAALFKRNSPFSIKPRLDPGLWLWLWKFARRCNHEAMMTSARARAALLESSRRLYDQLFADEPLECEWEKRGCLFVYQTSAAMEKYAKTDELLRREFGVAATRYDGPKLIELEPALKEGLAGGWHYEMDSHLRPDKLMSSWRVVLERLGVTVRENCHVDGFMTKGGESQAALAKGDNGEEELPADAFVVAAGALTPKLNRQLGCQVPIQPGKGYSLTMPRPGRCPRIPILFQEHKVAATPMQSGYRLGSTMEFAGYDTSINPRRLALLKQAAEIYLHEPYMHTVEEEWYGWRPMTYDGKPIIGKSPQSQNVWIAAGHNMLGLTMAPATGKLLAELIGEETPHIDPAPFSVERFA